MDLSEIIIAGKCLFILVIRTSIKGFLKVFFLKLLIVVQVSLDGLIGTPTSERQSKYDFDFFNVY